MQATIFQGITEELPDGSIPPLLTNNQQVLFALDFDARSLGEHFFVSKA